MIWQYTDETMRVVMRTVDGMWQSLWAEALSEEERATALPFVPDRNKLLDQAKDEIRAIRQPVMGVLDGLQASYITKGDIPTATVIEVAKQALRDITKLDLSACETLAQMKVVVMTRYALIAAASPALKSAFSQAVQ